MEANKQISKQTKISLRKSKWVQQSHRIFHHKKSTVLLYSQNEDVKTEI